MKPLLLSVALLTAAPLWAGSDLNALSPAERIAFGAEVRALLLDEPEIVQRAMQPPDYGAAAYRDEADADMALLETMRQEVLAGTDIALFVRGGCADCDAAKAELEEISKATGATFILHNLNEPGFARITEALELDEAPFYIMADRVLRGHMPAVVLTKYLTQK